MFFTAKAELFRSCYNYDVIPLKQDTTSTTGPVASGVDKTMRTQAVIL